MADPLDDYEMLEELGSKICRLFDISVTHSLTIVLGGSFGVVYKALEKGTNELVAVKHVSRVPTSTQTLQSSMHD